jgi:hypothetical protein
VVDAEHVADLSLRHPLADELGDGVAPLRDAESSALRRLGSSKCVTRLTFVATRMYAWAVHVEPSKFPATHGSHSP